MDKIGFGFALIGLGGLAESYGNVRQALISIALITIGSALIYTRVCKNEKKDSKRISNSNVLDRLYFLR